MNEKWFLIVWPAGILALVAALFVTRLRWRKDVRPFGRHSPIFDIVMHPEKYASPGSVRLIRTLTGIGWACLSVGVVLLVYEAVRRPSTR